MNTSPSTPATGASGTSGAGAAVYPLTVYFDGGCPICLAEMTNLQLRNTAGLLRFEDVSRPDFRDYPAGTDLPDLMTLLHVKCADGRVIRGAPALRLLYAGAQMRGMARLMNAPGLRQLADWAYPILARNRYRIPRPVAQLLFETSLRRAAERRAGASACQSGSCEIPAAPHTNPHSKE
ncbi:DUF393 domain-containing protein [Roseateles sp. SL47]|uniref:thiol-disulfide oxidoreductase DCC family protein n=1 Tax=Roseateles sp. SL47 TaxID=2995138 RepID=UPI00226D7FFB|nr:DUF393 domain-containing protein [Roseateles sp. SL47]WAC71305.1 DUF393 domain-containing protein [Roseateles sp. SL47]